MDTFGRKSPENIQRGCYRLISPVTSHRTHPFLRVYMDFKLFPRLRKQDVGSL